MLVYRVVIDYKEFLFTEALEALSFAERAALQQTENYNIKINIIKRPEEEKNDAPYQFDETKN